MKEEAHKRSIKRKGRQQNNLFKSKWQGSRREGTKFSRRGQEKNRCVGTVRRKMKFAAGEIQKSSQ